MKLWDDAFLSESLEHLNFISENAVQVQNRLLMQLLRENASTAFGKAHGFGRIQSPEEYSTHVPLTRYDDYRISIEKMRNGERNLIFSGDPAEWCISSGSTGDAKYIPLTRADLENQHTILDGMVMAKIREAFPEADSESLFGNILELGEFYQTFLPDGIPSAVRSGAWYRAAQNSGEFRGESFCGPYEVLFPERMEDLRYVKARCCLLDRSVTAIHGVFANRAVSFFRYLEENMEDLIHDLETGTVSDRFGVTEGWKKYLEEHCPADPKRGKELRTAYETGGRKGMLRRIWPKLSYVRAIGGGQFHLSMPAFHDYTEGLPCYPFAYAASESVLGVAQGMNVPGRYQLIADNCFYEFLPARKGIGEEVEQTVTFSDVEVGGEYELIITTLSGLWRYCLGDVVKVVDRVGEAPVVEVLYRKGLMMNLVGEQLDYLPFEVSIQRFFRAAHIHAEHYALLGSLSPENIHYQLLIELVETEASRSLTDLLQRQDILNRELDEALRAENVGYHCARMTGDLSPAEAAFVNPGTFQKWTDRLAASGRRMEQQKPIRRIENAAAQEFFLSRVILFEAEGQM